MKPLTALLLFTTLFGHSQQSVIVLGVAQDGGFPHIGCQQECQQAHQDPSLARYVTSLALINEETKQWWLFEASPDMDRQLQYFQELTKGNYNYLPDGIFLTHAHMGHYTGLMFLGREALGAKNVTVFVQLRMLQFLNENGPWSQLIALQNIDLVPVSPERPLQLNASLSVETFSVPHRDEFSETSGFRIMGKEKSYLFIPDVDKWEKWGQDIVHLVSGVDVAFLDATFYADGELPNRAMSEVPHPFVTETMDLFSEQPDTVKAKVHFIHFNHTNPILFDPDVRKVLRDKGFGIAEQGKAY